MDTDNSTVLTRGKGHVGWAVKGAKYMLTQDDLALGGEHAIQHVIQYTDLVSLKCILETYMIPLTNVTLIKLI